MSAGVDCRVNIAGCVKLGSRILPERGVWYKFAFGMVRDPQSGSLRAEMWLSGILYVRALDLDVARDAMFALLTPRELKVCAKALGQFWHLNPHNPNGYYRLDLTNAPEYQVT